MTMQGWAGMDAGLEKNSNYQNRCSCIIDKKFNKYINIIIICYLNYINPPRFPRLAFIFIRLYFILLLYLIKIRYYLRVEKIYKMFIVV